MPPVEGFLSLMKPAFNSKGFKAYQVSLDNETFDTLIERIGS